MNLVHISRYFRDERVPGWRKFVVLGAVAYVLLPIDLVPDVIPLIGWLDDIGAIGAALAFFARDVSNHAANAKAVPQVSAESSGSGVQVIDATPLRVRR
jgi:uncharacterized membrane protein YkvA (DUF1232 family)